MAGIRYKGQIFSGTASTKSADEVSYDNTDSGLTATNVQDALDELGDLSSKTYQINNIPVRLGFKVQNGNAQFQFSPDNPSSDYPTYQINFLKNSITVYQNDGSGWSSARVYSPKLMTKSFSFTMTYSSGYSNTNVDITTSGYTPIGIVGFILGSSYVSPSLMRISGNTLNIEARNHTTPSASHTLNAMVYILYTMD